MAKKDASNKASKPIPNKHLHSRVSYLYQAACHISSQTSPDAGSSKAQDLGATTTGTEGALNLADNEHKESTRSGRSTAFPPGLSHYLVSHLQSVSRKSQVRLSKDVKHSICKRCSTILIPGETSTSRIENLSRGAKKPWADVLVIKCEVCEAQKRFPVGAKRQPRKKDRLQTKKSHVPVASKKEDTSNGQSDSNGVTPMIADIDMQTAT